MSPPSRRPRHSTPRIARLTPATHDPSTTHQLHGATVKLGYANCKVCRCAGTCPAPLAFVTMSGDDPSLPTPPCNGCNGPTYVVKHVSFVDTPGHHDLINTMLTGASAFDGALLLVSRVG